MPDSKPDPPSALAPHALLRRVSDALSHHTLIELEALVPDLATGVRAALATVIPLSLATAQARPELAWMAIGGWLGTLADPGGSRGARARPLIAFTILGALEVAVSGIGSSSVVASALQFSIVAFFATMLRAFGPAESTLGTMLTVVAALVVGGHPDAPWKDAAYFALGSATALVLSTIVWPVWTHLPVRRAVANVFRELANYAHAVDMCLAALTPPDDPAWIAIARQHPRRVREAIEAARAMSIAIHARRGGETRLGSNLRLLLGEAESQFLTLATLSTEIESSRGISPSSDTIPSLALIEALYTSVYRSLVARSLGQRLPDIESLAPTTGQREPWTALLVDLETSARHARAMAGELDRGEVRATALESRAEPWAATMDVDWMTLRDAVSSRSPVVHHAVRVSLAGAIAVVLGTVFSPLHATWVIVTTLVVLQPYTGATVQRGAERVVGTILGGLVAIAITAVNPGPIALTAIMFPLSVAAVVTRPRSYRLFTFFLTPLFVLIAIRTPGDWWVACARAGDTLIGGAIALAATFLIFPRWEEKVGLPDALNAMHDAVDAYASAVLNAVSAVTVPNDRNESTAQRNHERRVEATAALSGTEAIVDRLLENPIRSAREARALDQVTVARRLTLATTTLDTLAARRSAGTDIPLEGAVARVERLRALLRRAAQEPVEAPRLRRGVTGTNS